MTVQFTRATKTQAKARIAVTGPAGAGKTFTALLIARGLSDKVPALVDTEAGSASKYADQHTFDGVTLDSFHPQAFIDAIAGAESAGYEVLIIDSLSHAWMGKDGVMEQVDRRKANSRSQFAAWQEPSLMHQKLIDAILHAKLHLIATMRSKMEYAQENGTVKRLGMAPVQREGTEYEFDVVLDLDQQHNGRVSKSRIAALADAVLPKPGVEFGKQLKAWLSEGAPVPPGLSPAPAIDDDTRTRIDQKRIAAQANVETKPLYDAAAAVLKDAGFKGWTDFFKRGTQAQAEAVERALNGADQPVLVG